MNVWNAIHNWFLFHFVCCFKMCNLHRRNLYKVQYHYESISRIWTVNVFKLYVPLVEGLTLTQADNDFCNCDCVYFISFCTVGRDFLCNCDTVFIYCYL